MKHIHRHGDVIIAKCYTTNVLFYQQNNIVLLMNVGYLVGFSIFSQMNCSKYCLMTRVLYSVVLKVM